MEVGIEKFISFIVATSRLLHSYALPSPSRRIDSLISIADLIKPSFNLQITSLGSKSHIMMVIN